MCIRDRAGVVAGDKVGLGHVVRRTDRGITKAQVRNGDAAGLLGVVLEVGLDVLVGVVADNLDGVLVRACLLYTSDVYKRQEYPPFTHSRTVRESSSCTGAGKSSFTPPASKSLSP